MRNSIKTAATWLFLPWTFLAAATPFLGVSTQSRPPWNRDADQLAEGVGLEVIQVVEDSAADTILQKGDILEKLDDQWLINPEQLSVLVQMKKPGDSMQVTYLRDGSRKTTEVTLGTRPLDLAASTPAPSTMTPGRPLSGPGLRTFPGMPSQLEQRFLEMERQMEAMQQQLHQQIPPMNHHQQSSISRNMTWMDGDTRVEYRSQNGKAEVVISENGKEQFRGPLNSAEDFQQVPEAFRDFLRTKGLEPEKAGIKL